MARRVVDWDREISKELNRYAARRVEISAERMHVESQHQGAIAACILPECASLKAQVQEIQKENR